MPRRVLILAGTNEARVLANRLVADGYDVTSSFAGVTENPILPQGKIRKGGFGGVDGLRRYLDNDKIDVVIDATHSFAAIISRHVVEAFPKVLRQCKKVTDGSMSPILPLPFLHCLLKRA
jgi:precorrin-6A/cobalt-precorrin-6A reductase